MRLEKTVNLTGNEILAKSIIDINGNKFLAAGTQIQSSYIKRLLSLGISIVYIEDEISKDIVIESFIPIEIHIEAKQIISKQMKLFKESGQIDANEISKIVDRIISEIIRHPFALLNFRDIRMQDEYTISHCVNVCILALMLATRLGLTQDKVRNIGIGAIIHDFGKILIPQQIINKKGRLSEDEFKQIKAHPVNLYNAIKDNPAFSPTSKIVALMHHEKLDGTGYPMGVTGDKIHASAKICAICDVFDAITCDNLYHSSKKVAEAIEFLEFSSNTAFEKEYVEVFIKQIPIYPNGTIVELSNKCIGIIIENTSKNILRPKVRLLYDCNAEKQMDYEVIDLMKELNIKIEKEVTEALHKIIR